MAGKGNAIERALVVRKGKAPVPENSPTVSHQALQDANVEVIRWLQDLALEVPYSDFAARGMTVQNFLRTRQLAFQDVFEDISDEVKSRSLDGVNPDGSPRPSGLALEDLRAQPEYDEMQERFRALARELASAETAEEWLKKTGPRARRNLERYSRSSDPKAAKEAARAAAEILERELPKVSRAQISGGNHLHMTPGVAAMLAKAFAEAKIASPVPAPVAEAEEKAYPSGDDRGSEDPARGD